MSHVQIKKYMISIVLYVYYDMSQYRFTCIYREYV